ncbi:hypothetical protein E4K10_47530 [Streptomyces sp. T1317-0309]|nr:hypothetical protein E4K10_47530 [Streptomyces sp. T1317-0309]
MTVTDAFEQSTGDVEIDKTIKGPGAGRQGEVVIRLECDVPGGAFDRRFVINAGPQPAHTVSPSSAASRPVHTAITEATTGENKDVRLSKVTIEPTTITVRAGVTSRISITDKYDTHGKGGKGGKGGKDHKPGGGKDGKSHKRVAYLPGTGTTLPTGHMAASSLTLVLTAVSRSLRPGRPADVGTYLTSQDS